MPYYDFICTKCKDEFEQNVPVARRDQIQCPKCGAPAGRKPAAPAFTMNGKMSVQQRAGSGWNDVLKKVKAGAGKKNTIHTK